MSEGAVRRFWVTFVVLCFCAPLYIGLGRADLRGDEAGHSFSVDRILETGDWLAPRSSPSENAVFLEKPPLKFWIVAAPIRLGLLPHNEFGLRFWDPLFAAVAFLYVFAIGSRLGGGICGVVAVLLLFVHGPLLFDHGIRGNNMEAALLLSYCGGVYHFLEWIARASANRPPDRRSEGASGQAVAVGLYFVLGFMTKFVAALFLPVVLAVPVCLYAPWRTTVSRHWRMWLGVALLALALIAPWFLYAQWRFGAKVWRIMLAAQVYTRFTSYLDPTHVQPWSYYFTTIYEQFARSRSIVLVVGGLALLLVDTVRRRWPEGAVVLLWFALPVSLISLGTSKLYHYAYPFLPPAALAGGYLVSRSAMWLPDWLARALAGVDTVARLGIPQMRKTLDRPVPRRLVLVIGTVAASVLALDALHVPMKVVIGGAHLFKSSSVLRPALVVLAAGTLVGGARTASRAVVWLLLLSQLPLSAYRGALTRLGEGTHPMRAARDCVLQVDAQSAVARSRGLYVSGQEQFGHEHYYYFRKIRPWEIAEGASAEKLDQYLFDPDQWRPMLVTEAVYREFQHSVDRREGSDRNGSVPLVSFTDVVLLLPGPYSVCSGVTRRETPH